MRARLTTDEKRFARGAIWALTAAAALVFCRVWQFPFASIDDDTLIFESLHVRSGLSWDTIKWALRSELLVDSLNVDYWSPLTFLSHVVVWELCGDWAGGHHLVNVLLHMANASLLLLLLLRWTQKKWESAAVAMLFAVHPLHVESVAWVTERNDVLSTLFWCLALHAYTDWTERRRRLAWTVAAFAAGLAAKPMLVTLPFLMLLLDVWPLGRLGWSLSELKKRAAEKWPLFLLTAASCTVTLLGTRMAGFARGFDEVSLPARLANAAISYVVYIRQMFWPADLRVFVPHPGEGVAFGLAAACLLLLAAATAAAWRRRKQGWPLVGWLWYVGTLLPVSGIAQVGGQARADRYTYIPLVGLFIIVVWSVSALRRRLPARAVRGAAAAALAALMIAAHLHADDWRSSVVLLGKVARAHPEDHDSLNFYAEALDRAGRKKDAVEVYRKALALRPDSRWTLNNLGKLVAEMGHPQVAEAYFRQAIAAWPGKTRAYYNLGAVLLEQKRFAEAEGALRTGLRITPHDAQVLTALGIVLAEQRRHDEAMAMYREALKSHSGFWKARNGLGLSLLTQGGFAEAEEHFRAALAARPDFSEGWNNLGLALAAQNNLAGAITAYERALALKPEDAGALHNVGVLWLRRGEIKEARRRFEQALAADPKLASAHNSLGMVAAREGDLRGALALFKKAAALDPRDAQAWANVGLAHLKLGETAAGRRALENALAVDPRHGLARGLMASLAGKTKKN